LLYLYLGISRLGGTAIKMNLKLILCCCVVLLGTRASAFVSPARNARLVKFENALTTIRPSLLPPQVPATIAPAPLAAAAAEAPGSDDAMAAKLKVGGYFSLWYALNIGYNIYNKQVLNILPLPWIVGTIQLACGLLYFVPLWLSGIRKAPKLSAENIKTLSPVAAMHTAAHITAVLSLGAGAVSFTHIVKAAEPLFTSACGAVFMKEIFAWQVYATLLPVIFGVGLASLKELSFSWVAFGNAMGSNLASALRGTFAKQAMSKPQGENMNAVNLYSVLTCLGMCMLLPFAAVIEGPKLGAALKAATAVMPQKELAIKTLLSGLFYYSYNEVAFLALDSVNPVTHAVGNTIKRVVVILASVLFFGTQMTPLGTLGSAIAIAGVLLYSLAKNKFKN